MTYFAINGVEKPVPVSGTTDFKGLMKHLASSAGENQLLASIRVDGVEVDLAREEALSAVPISDLRSVEIIYSNPREMAEETLGILKLFTVRLSELSRRAGEEAGEAEFHKLVDGIQTFADTVTGVKSILKIGFLQPVNVLEADLVSILKDLLETLTDGDKAYRDDLLKVHLPKNLEDWCNEGIPALTRARDC